ncbi:MAG: hypothetical protein U0Z53_04255 [Blastocatellia bacterium]
MKRYLQLALVLFFTGLFINFLFTDHARAQKQSAAKASVKKVPSSECLSCHTDPNTVKEVDGKTVSVTVSEEVLKNSVHGTLDCVDCHSDVKEYPHDPAPQRASCTSCHESTVTEHQGSIHGKPGKNGEPVAKCSDCHGSHDILGKNEAKSTINRFNIANTCAKCHTDPKLIQQYSMKPAQFIDDYRKTVHGKGLYSSGLVISATCSDCHSVHDIRSKKDPESSMGRAKQPETCSKCHQGILNDFARSAHGEAWKKGNDKGPVCSTCHSSHEIQNTTLASFQAAALNQCGKCHKEESATYRDTFHGKATSLGMVVAAKCSDCHTAHLNLPQKDPMSTVHNGNVVKTCSQCHADITPKAASFNPHPEPTKKKKSALLYYVNLFMKWLLISVFGFFGVHTLLWFQRSVMAWIRKELPKASEEGPYITRFITPHRITHIVIVMSFIGLALTGIPLKYSYTRWGHYFSSWLGGVEVSRFFHRTWAVATLGYALYHLWFIFQTVFIKKERSILFGPNSMIPRKQDVIDFFHNLRWFLYLGPYPKLDRWTYWEKFDYYAVFWGVPVIGLSGLMLWFPWLFTKFLPGSILNVAMIIHGEEALLAVGFIFTFHFFHNHLRPENFPMDTVIFTGKMPLEKFKHERPAEYERLVKEGKLEAMLTDPPTPLARRLSFWFGGLALIFGLLLAASIFTTYLVHR